MDGGEIAAILGGVVRLDLLQDLPQLQHGGEGVLAADAAIAGAGQMADQAVLTGKPQLVGLAALHDGIALPVVQ